MKIVSSGFTNRTKDNDVKFLNFIISSVEKIDIDGYIYFYDSKEKVRVVIVPSSAKLFDVLLKDITELMSLFKIKVEFSKSMKNDYKIDFNLPKENAS